MDNQKLQPGCLWDNHLYKIDASFQEIGWIQEILLKMP